MNRVFIDSSVLFSAAYSSRGFARDLLLMGAREEIQLVISTLVIEETKRNLADFAPEAFSRSSQEGAGVNEEPYQSCVFLPSHNKPFHFLAEIRYSVVLTRWPKDPL